MWCQVTGPVSVRPERARRHDCPSLQRNGRNDVFQKRLEPMLSRQFAMGLDYPLRNLPENPPPHVLPRKQTKGIAEPSMQGQRN